MNKILITGASGQLGRQTVEFLLERLPAGQIAALARDPAKLSDLAQRGVDVRRGDYLQPESLVSAFAGVNKVLLVSTTTFTDMLAQHINVIEAAKAAGVAHIHYTAIQHPEGSNFVLPQVTEMDAATEQAMRASGMKVTILRNPLYLDIVASLLGDDVTAKGVAVPGGSGTAALATRRDLAEATAVVLATEGHAGRDYILSGSESVTLQGIADLISEATGHDVPYREITEDAFVESRVLAGWPAPSAAFVASWFRAFGAGEFSEITGDLERLIGRRPTTARACFEAFYRATREAGTL